MYHGYLNVSGVPVVLGGTCCVREYLFVSKVHKFVSKGPVYVRGTCMFVSGVPV